MRAYFAALVAATGLWTLGCASDPEPPVACPAGNTIGGICAGAPAGALCDEDTCGDPGCSALVVVSNDGELANALTGAAPGSCVALRPGTYLEALVPTGVKLLGKGPDFVTVGHVGLAAGTDSLLRGVTVTSGGITVSAQNSTVDAVRVTNASGDGLTVAAGASATVTRSEISGSTRYATSAFDAAGLHIDGSVIVGSKGPGVWAQCGQEGCDCGSPPDVSVTNTVIRDTKVVGLALVGVHAALDNVEISDNTVDGSFQPGGGLAVWGCSVLGATGVRVLNNSNFGVLVDDSSATFTLSSTGVGLEVANNLRGIWAQHIGQTVSQTFTVEGATVTGNTGIGLGVDGSSLNVTVTSCTVSNTSLVSLPVLVGGVSAGAESVGDGVNWFGTSQMHIDGLTVSGSARASVLINGPVAPNSSLAHVTLEGNDLTLGILQQNLPANGTQPQVLASPPITTTSVEQLHIADGLGIPPEF